MISSPSLSRECHEDNGSHPRSERGLTLIEMSVVVALFSLAFMTIWQAFDVTTSEAANGVSSASLDAALRKCMARLAEDIVSTGVDPDGTEYLLSHPRAQTTTADAIRFQSRIGLDGTVDDWSVPVTYLLTDSPGEDSSNAVDDDGDGLVDEQMLQRVSEEVLGDDTITIADGILGVTFVRDADTDVIQITVTAGRPTTAGPLIRSLGTRVTLRNRN